MVEVDLQRISSALLILFSPNMLRIGSDVGNSL